jgi:hypothetical protein
VAFLRAVHLDQDLDLVDEILDRLLGPLPPQRGDRRGRHHAGRDEDQHATSIARP